MNPKNTVIFCSLLLTIIGLFFLSITSLNESLSSTGDPYLFLKKQLTWTAVSVITFFIGRLLPTTLVKKYTTLIYIASTLLLLTVLIPGFGSQTLGARRWLDFGVFGVQPSEISKISLIIFFSAFFSSSHFKLKPFLIYLGIPVLLIMLEPNLSTTIIITATILTLYYLANGSMSSIITISLIAFFLSFILTITSPYRQARLQNLINSNAENKSTYHSQQLAITIASGGIFGKGFANSTQKYKFLPKVSTDSILAVIGEEIGLIGISGILILYILLITSLFKIGQTTSHQFSQLLIYGSALLISFQTITNICAVTGLIPLTGVPLPFISYGGSSITVLYYLIGISQNNAIGDKLLYLNNSQYGKENNHHRQTSHSRH